MWISKFSVLKKPLHGNDCIAKHRLMVVHRQSPLQDHYHLDLFFFVNVSTNYFVFCFLPCLCVSVCTYRNKGTISL